MALEVIEHFAHFMNGFPPAAVFLLLLLVLEPAHAALHEFGHALVALARLPGQVVIRVGLEPSLMVLSAGRLEARLHPLIRPWRFDATCQLPASRASRSDAILIALGGPAASLSAGVLAVVVSSAAPQGSVLRSIFTVMGCLGIASSILSLTPMTLTDSHGRQLRTDGARVVQALRKRPLPERRSSAFHRFTPGARCVVVYAQDEARAVSHDHIGTEHILLGLLRAEEGAAARVLASFDVTLETVRMQIAYIVGQGHYVAAGQIPFTPRAKRILQLAIRESLSHNRYYIDTEHILAGLLSVKDGISARVLPSLGLDIEEIRARLEPHL